MISLKLHVPPLNPISMSPVFCHVHRELHKGQGKRQRRQRRQRSRGEAAATFEAFQGGGCYGVADLTTNPEEYIVSTNKDMYLHTLTWMFL